MSTRSPQLGALNLNLLVALDALLETRSLRLSAERCGVTQSAMSHRLRQLRDLTGDPLLVRSGNAMLPTPRAEGMRAPLRENLLQLQALVREDGAFQPCSSARRFTIAASDVVAVTALPELVARVERDAPGVDLDIIPVDGDRLREQLRAGIVDVAIGPPLAHAPGLRRRALYDVTFVVVVRAGHPAADGPLDLDAYCALDHALVSVSGRGPGLVDEVLARRGRSRRVALRIPYFLAAPPLLARSDLVLTAPRQAAEHLAELFGLRLLPVPLELPTGRIGMVWHERYEHDPGARWLRDVLVQATAGLR